MPAALCIRIMKIEYSYGLMAYFLKYVGSVGMAILALLFLFFLGLAVASGVTNYERMLFIVICIIMVIFCTKGAYYFFKYSSSFTKKYEFSSSGIKVKDKSEEAWYPIDEIEQVLYLKALKIFEITFYNKEINKKLVLMNNGQTETNSFITLKEFLFKHPKILSRWF